MTFGNPEIRYENGRYFQRRDNLISVSWDKFLKYESGRVVNSAQKPVRLWYEFLKCFDADLVLDLFAGTCSLSYAAVLHFKNFIAVEKHKHIIGAANDRLKVLTGKDFRFAGEDKEIPSYNH